MAFAVAVVSPPDRHDTSGGAFIEVAEGLHHALTALGHDSVLTNRLDLDDRRTIVLGGNLLVQYGLEPPRNPVFYNLEQLGHDLPWMQMPEFLDLFRRYPTWDYSQANVDRLADLGLPRPAYVPVGYVPELTRIAPVSEDIDVLFYGALSERRYAVLRALRDRGLRVKWLPGTYGAARDAWVARSKVVLNLHYFEAKIFAIVRVSYLLANRRAVVSEHSANPALERDLQSGIAFAEYDDLVDRCVELVRNERARRELADRGFEAFSARSQAAILDHALSGLRDVTHASPPRGESSANGRQENSEDSAADRLRERQLFTRNLFRHKLALERDLLLARAESDPDDIRAVFYLAQTYLQLEDFANARKWYSRRIEMGGSEEEVYFAMYRLAQSTQQLGAPWADVEDAYLRAWHFRPARAEPLYAIAAGYRNMRRYQVGYLFAQRAADTPVPEDDLFLPADVAQIYGWRAADEQAICAAWIGKHAEAFELCRRLLARTDIPDPDRQRIAANRDSSVPAMMEAALTCPEVAASTSATNAGEVEVTVSLIGGPDRKTTERTVNSFLNCCLDAARVGRFLVFDAGLSDSDRALLQKRYEFLEFTGRNHDEGPVAQFEQLRAQIRGRFWLHLGAGWRFFAPENLITRLTAVLEAESQVFQVGINFADAARLTGTSAAEELVCHAPDAGRYLLTDVVASGPSMYDIARLHEVHSVNTGDPDAVPDLEPPTAGMTMRTASLDEVLCISV